MYTDTITLFNRKPGGQSGDTWYPTVIKNVDLNIDRAAILAKYGSDSNDNAALHIRHNTENGKTVVSCGNGIEKQWMSPKEWDKTENSITFNGGANFDFFWKGEWEGGIVSDSDYGEEGFYTHMNRIHDYVFAISSVAMYSVIPHFEIMGK